MAGVRSTPRCGKYVGWYTNMHGKQTFFAGMSAIGPAPTRRKNRVETLRMAERFEDDHRQIRLGYRPAPKSADKHRATPIQAVISEYLEWGKSQGGHHQRPWRAETLDRRTRELEFWRKALGLGVMGDLDGILPKVEAVLREKQAAGRSGKTLQCYRETLGAFCEWAKLRGYLAGHPLEGSTGFDVTPKRTRRALTPEEIGKLLAVCSEERRLLYETAMSSGLRASELRGLRVRDLDVIGNGLRLDPAWTKNGNPGFQPVSADLAARLHKSAEGKDSGAPLLNVPKHTDRMMRDDLKTAKVAPWTPEGTADFHALRGVYATLVIESGANIKEAQSLMRHATPNLTLNVYAKTRQNRLSEVAEKVGAVVNSRPENAHCRTRLAVGAELQSSNGLQANDLQAATRWSGRADLNCRPPGPEPGALSKLSHAPIYFSSTRPAHYNIQPRTVQIAFGRIPAGAISCPFTRGDGICGGWP